MKSISVIALALTVACATPVFAQKGQGKAHASGRQRAENGTTRGGRVDRVQTRNRGYVVETRNKGGGPAFCRSGAGHPVYGRSWCVQKGFGLGNSNWNRVTWGDVILQPRRASIGDVLGSVVLGRLTDYAAQRLGLVSPLYGSWLTNTTDRRVYIVRSGSVPVAEMVDVNGDRRADYVLLYNR